MTSRRALLLVLLCACGQGPDDLFVIDGRTVTEEGRPLDGVPLHVTRSFTGSCNSGRLLHSQHSADGGLFSFDLVRVEVQSLSGAATACARLQADFASGAKAWTDLYFLPNRLRLPDFYDWRGGLTFDGAVPMFRPVRPPEEPLQECRGHFPRQEHVVHGLVVRGDAGVAWDTTDTTVLYDVDDAGITRGQSFERLPLRLPADVLEDFAVEVQLQARRIGCVEVSGGGTLGAPGPYVTNTRWSSPGTVQLQGTRVPVSRGARCDEFLQPCPLTDGSAAVVDLPRPMNNFKIRLARPTNGIRALVLRGGLTESSRPALDQLSIRVGEDSLTQSFSGHAMPLEEIVFDSSGTALSRTWLYVPLSRVVGTEPSSTVELEIDRVFFKLGELSLFE